MRKKVGTFYRRGQTVSGQGAPIFGIYLIRSGKLKTSVHHFNGKESIVRISGPGDIVGLRALFAGELSQKTITAIEDSEICFFSKTEVMNLIREFPDVAVGMLARLSKTLGAAEKTLASLMQDPVKKRFAGLLQSLSDSYSEKAGTSRKRINLKISRDEIASVLGTTPETVTRLTTELKKARVIEVENKYYYISNPGALSALAGEEH
ncbi:MAG: Crp/Fnr family transcriptional regulator [Bdellovibrionales bacterium]|nr:Crp/Fnr family transcriptional regulator [Bdellovibrionales bacterium]